MGGAFAVCVHCISVDCPSIPRGQLWAAKYSCLGLGDLRYTAAERESLALGLAKKPACCVRAGLARGLRAWAYRQAAAEEESSGGSEAAGSPNAAAKFLVGARRACLRIGWFVRMSIAHVECFHKLHREILRAGAGKSSLGLLCAASVNIRADRRFQEERSECENEDEPVLAIGESPPASDDDRVVVGPFAHVRRKLSASEVFGVRTHAR